MKNKFKELFPDKKPIIGMIHLAGEEPRMRAEQELAVFKEFGINGALVENYHGSTEDVEAVLKSISLAKTYGYDYKLSIGVNVLPNEFNLSIPWADKYGAGFVQLDHVSGTYAKKGKLNIEPYNRIRAEHPHIIVLGGVWPKYYHPIEGSNLEEDLREGMKRADAIVVTGEGTGEETPLSKIKIFREIIGDDFPLIVGAGVNPQNAYEQAGIADGIIVGSYLKVDNCTENPLDRAGIRNLIDVINEVRQAI